MAGETLNDLLGGAIVIENILEVINLYEDFQHSVEPRNGYLGRKVNTTQNHYAMVRLQICKSNRMC